MVPKHLFFGPKSLMAGETPTPPPLFKVEDVLIFVLPFPYFESKKSWVVNRAVESEFKSNPIFPIFSDFLILSDFLSNFPHFRLSDFTAPVVNLMIFGEHMDFIHAKSGRYLRYISAIFFGFSAKF